MPLGCIASLISFALAVNGLPATAVKAAVELLMLNTEVLAAAELATSKNVFVGSNTIESGDERPVGNGEFVALCNAPEVGLMRYAETLAPLIFVT